jgi:hypothetical protein
MEPGSYSGKAEDAGMKITVNRDGSFAVSIANPHGCGGSGRGVIWQTGPKEWRARLQADNSMCLLRIKRSKTRGVINLTRVQGFAA